MKKATLLCFLIIAIQTGKAQTPNWIWAVASTTTGGCCSYTVGVAVDSTCKNIFVGGRCSGTMTFGGKSVSAGGADNPFVGRFDSSSSFNSTWMSEYTYSGGFDYPSGFCIDKKGNSYLSGWTNSGYSSPMFLEKYNSAGALQWELTPTNSAGGGFMAVTTDNEGYVYVAGTFENGYGSLVLGSFTLPYTGSGRAIFVAKLDSNGNFIWAKSAYGSGASDGWNVGRGIALDNAGHVFVSGGYSGAPTFGTITVPTATGYGNLFVAEYDTSGNALNVYTAISAGIDNGDWGSLDHITTDSCGNIYVTGYFEGTAKFGSFTLNTSGGQDAFIAKLSNYGVWQWANSIGGSSNDNGTGVILDKNSDVYAIGNFSSGTVSFSGTATTVSGNAYIAKYANSSGALLWAQSASVPGGGFNAVAVDNQKYVYLTGSLNSTATFGSVTAYSGSGVYVAKLDTVPSRTIVPVISANYCPGETITIPYTVTGIFNSGNAFTAQLSNDSGSFVIPTFLGSTISDTSGTITITIPSNIPSGSNYLIRVISSSPSTSSWANGCGAYFVNNVYIDDFYVTIGNSLTVTVTPDSPAVCNGSSVLLTANGGSGLTYQWSNGAVTDTTTVNPTTDTSYIVTVSNGTCSGSDTVKVKVNAAPPLAIQPLSPIICNGLSTSLTVPVSGTNYTWTPSTGLNTSIGDTVLASPTITTTYTVTGTDSLGCSVTGSDVVSVNTVVSLNIQPPSPASDCNGQPIILSVPVSGQDYVWSPSTYLNQTTGDTVTATPLVNITYTVSGTDSLGCNVSGTEVISLSSGPSKPTITQNDSVLISSSTQSNQWLRNDTAILGATNQDYIVTISGYYQVTVSNPANGCSTTSDSILASGLNQLFAISDQLSIYPNPFNSNIIVHISSSVRDVSSWNLQVIDVLGRTIFTRASLNYNNYIDLSYLPSGMYFITIINNTTTVVVTVIKQN